MERPFVRLPVLCSGEADLVLSLRDVGRGGGGNGRRRPPAVATDQGRTVASPSLARAGWACRLHEAAQKGPRDEQRQGERDDHFRIECEACREAMCLRPGAGGRSPKRWALRHLRITRFEPRRAVACPAQLILLLVSALPRFCCSDRIRGGGRKHLRAAQSLPGGAETSVPRAAARRELAPLGVRGDSGAARRHRDFQELSTSFSHARRTYRCRCW